MRNKTEIHDEPLQLFAGIGGVGTQMFFGAVRVWSHKTPDDLRTLPCISFSHIGSIGNLEKGEQRQAVTIKVAHSLGSLSLCMEFALDGHGIAMLSDHFFLENEHKGELVRVLPDWTGPSHDMYLAMAGCQAPRRVKIFVDHITEHLVSQFAN